MKGEEINGWNSSLGILVHNQMLNIYNHRAWSTYSNAAGSRSNVFICKYPFLAWVKMPMGSCGPQTSDFGFQQTFLQGSYEVTLQTLQQLQLHVQL